MSFLVRFWGVRGSLPSSPPPHAVAGHVRRHLKQFFASGFSQPEQIDEYLQRLSLVERGGYGTATTCVEVRSGKGQIIIDGGSGIHRLSEEMMKGPARQGRGTIHIFLTHFHWDHLIGLPFFAPHFVAGNRIHYYAVQPELEKIVRLTFQKPMFPVPFEALGAQVHFHQLEPRKARLIEGMKITPYQLDHPDPCWGFRIESQGKVYSHCVDTEALRHTREDLGEDLPLYQNVDLMYFDAQYTLPELSEKANWGHSASQVGLEIAFRENVKRILFAHHDPGATAHQLHKLRRETREYYAWRVRNAAKEGVQLPRVLWRLVHEGLEVKLV